MSFSYALLHETNQFKKEKKQKIELYLQQEKQKFQMKNIFSTWLFKNKWRKHPKYKLCTNNKTLYIEWFLEMIENFKYDATFSDNILAVGQTACGKTSFVQSLGKNKMFGAKLKSFDWVKNNLNKKQRRRD